MPQAGGVCAGETRFHWLMAMLLVASNIGTHIDAWYHAHYGFAIESFLTPPHYLLYASWLSMGAAAGVFALSRARSGERFGQLLPPGYHVAAIGIGVFLADGVFDFAWHGLVGFEQNFEFTLSPSHFVLLAGALLVSAGFVRHSLYRRQRGVRGAEDWLLALGVAFVLIRVLWPTWYYDPFTIDYAAGGAVVGRIDAMDEIAFAASSAPVAGVAGMLLLAAILVGFVVLPLQRWRLPTGAASLILLYPMLLRTPVTDMQRYLPAVVVAAVAVEVLWGWMRRGEPSRRAALAGYGAIGALLPATLLTTYFAIMASAGGGIVWPLTLWVGAIAQASAVGLLVSWGLVSGQR